MTLAPAASPTEKRVIQSVTKSKVDNPITSKIKRLYDRRIDVARVQALRARTEIGASNSRPAVQYGMGAELVAQRIGKAPEPEGTARVRHQDRGASFSWCGRSYAADDDSGVLTIPLAAMPRALSHGFCGPIPEGEQERDSGIAAPKRHDFQDRSGRPRPR